MLKDWSVVILKRRVKQGAEGVRGFWLCMCFEGSFDGRDESRMSNTVNYPSCETFMSLCLKNHFNTQFTDYHLSTETIESTDGETRQNG